MMPVQYFIIPCRILSICRWVPHEGVVGAYARKGVRSLYPWQAGALECGEDGGNLVYCAPTSGKASSLAFSVLSEAPTSTIENPV
jgi:hypothetical protein